MLSRRRWFGISSFRDDKNYDDDNDDYDIYGRTIVKRDEFFDPLTGRIYRRKRRL